MAFGPYSAYALEESYFLGFTSEENNENLLRYPMHEEVQNAIKLALQSIQDPTSGLLQFKDWPAENRNSIKILGELFQDCEVIPYIYAMETINGSEYGSNRPRPSLTNAISTCGIPTSKLDSFNGPTFYADAEDLYSDGGYAKIIGGYGGTYNSQFFGRWQPFTGNFMHYKSYFANKLVNAASITDIVARPYTPSVLEAFQNQTSETTDYWVYEDYNDLFSEKLPTRKKTVQEILTTYGNYKFFTGAIGYNNSSDGTYNENNLRSGYTKQYLDAIGQAVFAQGGFALPYVFFVKTKAPWYNVDGTVDETKEPVQYWAFNAKSLIAQRNSVNWGYPLGNSAAGGIFGGNEKYAWDGSMLGIGIGYNGPVSSVVSKAAIYYPPFPYFMAQTSFFNDPYNPPIMLGGCYKTNQDYAPATGAVASQTGITLLVDDESKILRFFVEGLGLKASLNDEEVLKKNYSEWEKPYFPPFGPATEPGAGGQTGGETGGGSGIGGTEAGEKYDQISDGSIATTSGLFGNRYALTPSEVSGLQAALLNDSLWTTIVNFFKDNPDQGLISLVKVPFDLSKFNLEFEENIKILNRDIGVMGMNIGNSIRTRINMGSINFAERFGSFLDYDPYTKIKLYLPFFGFKDISADVVMGRQIKVYYNVDYSDGSAIAVVLVSNEKTSTADFSNIAASGYTPQYIFSGSIGQITPLTKNDAEEKTQSAIKSVLTTLAVGAAAAVTGGAGAAAAAPAGAGTTSTAGAVLAGTAGAAAANTASTLLTKTTYTSGGVVDGEHAYAVNNLVPYAIIEYPETNIPSSFGGVAGFKTNLYTELKNCVGFTQCDDIKINLNCTQKEADQIKEILTKGVIINE